MILDDEDQLEKLFAAYVDRLNAGEKLRADSILAENPCLGERLLEYLDQYLDTAAEDQALGVLGDFTLRRQIGRGGMGVVYEAWQGSMDRVVALKVLPAAVAADDRAYGRFLQEVRAAGKLSHPNVVAVHASGQDERTPYYAMEFVDGETLAQILATLADATANADAATPFGRKGALAFYSNVAEAFADVADGLQHAHSKGVTHRDIKPSNLILDGEGRLRILDFGLARLEGQESLTLSGDFVGTPLYMSPEQARRKKVPVDHRTDVYSLGATMYETICGQPPFRGKDHADTLSRIIAQDPVEPRKINPRVPPDLETVVLKCLRKDAGDRYGTAEALGQDLRRFVRGDPIEARPQAGWERALRRLRRHRTKLLTAAVFVALLGSVFWFAYRSRQAEIEALEATYEKVVGDAVLEIFANEFVLKSGRASSGVRGWNSEIFDRRLPRDVFTGSSRRQPTGEALARLEEITRRLPRKRDAHFHLARAYALLERLDDALDQLALTLDCDATFVPARVLQMELSAADGHDRRAGLERIWHEYERDEGWIRSWLLAYRSMGRKRWSEAAAAYRQLIARRGIVELEPYVGFSIDAYMGRGIALVEARDYTAAQDAFNRAAALAPGAVEPEFFLAKACYLEGTDAKQERAEAIFQELHLCAPDARKQQVALWTAAVYGSVRDYDRALKWSGQIRDPGIEIRLAIYLNFRRGSYDEAIRLGRKLGEGNSRDPIARLYYARALLADRWGPDPPGGRTIEELRRAATEAVALDPGNVAAWRLRALAEAEAVLYTRRRVMNSLRNSRTLAWLAPLVLRVCGIRAGEEVAVVVPNVNETVAADGFATEEVFPMRLQQVYPAQQFALIEGPTAITAMAFRPSYRRVGEPRSPLYGDVVLSLSTTQKEASTLSDVFEENVGPDETTVLNRQVFTVHTGGGSGSGPRSFDYLYVFDEPFLYDPAQGNLLSDWASCSGREPSGAEEFSRALGEGTQIGARDCAAEVATWRVSTMVTQLIFELPHDPEFRRGDCNGDGTVDISDPIFSLGAQFIGEGDPLCDDAGDANDDGVVDISDPIGILGALFLGDVVIPAPGTLACGVDPTADDLGCETAPKGCE